MPSNSKQILLLDIFKSQVQQFLYSWCCHISHSETYWQKGTLLLERHCAFQHHTTARISHLKWPSPVNTGFGNDVFRQKSKLTRGKKKKINQTMHCFISRMWSFFYRTRSIKSQILQLIIWIAHLQEAKESIYSRLCPFLLLPHSPHFSDVVLLPVPSNKSLPRCCESSILQPPFPRMAFISLPECSTSPSILSVFAYVS